MRVATEVLDAAVLGHLADVVCAPARVDALEEIATRRGLAVGLRDAVAIAEVHLAVGQRVRVVG